MSLITISTKAGTLITLRPVPMPRFPSDTPEDWNRFQREHVAGGEMHADEVDRLQRYMRRQKTEALTDGTHHYTIAGNGLAYCNPAAIA